MAAFRHVASLRAKHSSDRLRTAGISLANKDRSPTTLRGKVSFNKSWLSKTNLQPLSIVSRSVQSLFNPSAINTLWITSVISVSTSDTYILRYSNSKRQNKQHGIYTCTIFHYMSWPLKISVTIRDARVSIQFSTDHAMSESAPVLVPPTVASEAESSWTGPFDRRHRKIFGLG